MKKNIKPKQDVERENFYSDDEKYLKDLHKGANAIHAIYETLIERAKYKATWMLGIENKDLKKKMNRLLILGKVGV